MGNRAALSVAGPAPLVGFFVKISSTSYDSWRYIASPNTVVSIIATISKAALLVPVSLLLGQLNWNQDSTPASALLYHLQAIDQASYGPGGALDVLWRSIKELRMNVLIFAGAFITILALAVDLFGHEMWTLRKMDEMQPISESIYATMHREEDRPVFIEG
ncbi:hypothetical protein N7481_006895 [Penicillium waksmanii]|uniref:uncharacterized protein n=1 Tax=Penicillium waksmanii TaxID=69791 RepID=UPI002546B966|nr:uncharacterized protein N7481_006895 [Penicillium waksmanii]KAJ5979597.1 hypothetical protein N7481_006895 [Penicillium waksmanii]